MGVHIKRINYRGDTIVEVLIAMAVVSSVLAGAFTVTQKSTLAVRDSQERGEMLQILQGQVEMVRSIAVGPNANSSGIFVDGPYFCINPATRQKSSLTNNLPPLAADPMNYAGSCGNISSRYNVAIKFDNKNDSDDSNDIFVFHGRWEKVGGGKNSMQFSYRISP